jgi:hypothetical protein
MGRLTPELIVEPSTDTDWLMSVVGHLPLAGAP